MTTTEQALLIILAIFLAFFLILAIITLFWVIKILKQLKAVIDTAEHLIEKAENITEFFEKSAPKVALTRLVGNLTEVVFNRDRRKK